MLRENLIRFQTPLTRMRIHFDSGAVTYSDAQEVPEDLRKRGYAVKPICAKKSTQQWNNTAVSLSKLLPWHSSGVPLARGSDYQDSIRERLRGFRRDGRGVTAPEN